MSGVSAPATGGRLARCVANLVCWRGLLSTSKSRNFGPEGERQSGEGEEAVGGGEAPVRERAIVTLLGWSMVADMRVGVSNPTYFV